MALSSLWRLKTKLNKNTLIIKLKTMNTNKDQVPQWRQTTVNRCFYINFKNSCNFIFLLQIFYLYLYHNNNEVII